MTIEKKIEKILKKKFPLFFKDRIFSWEYHSKFVIEHCPQHLDSNKFNWENSSWAVVNYCPEKLDINKASLTNILLYFPKFKTMSLKEIKKQAILNNL